MLAHKPKLDANTDAPKDAANNVQALEAMNSCNLLSPHTPKLVLLIIPAKKTLVWDHSRRHHVWCNRRHAAWCRGPLPDVAVMQIV